MSRILRDAPSSRALTGLAAIHNGDVQVRRDPIVPEGYRKTSPEVIVLAGDPLPLVLRARCMTSLSFRSTPVVRRPTIASATTAASP